MFNNDFEVEREGGQNKGKQAAERLCRKGITARALIPSQHNDWNDRLQALNEKNPEHELRHSSNRQDIGRQQLNLLPPDFYVYPAMES